jgi:hypothetical protein
MAAFNFHKRQTRRWWYVGATFVVAAFFTVFYVVGAGAATTGPSVADYSQCANGTATALTCDSGWINGILNANNSSYREDEVTPQRLVVDFPTSGSHSFDLQYLIRKGNNHAYDSLATWNHTEAGATRCLGFTGKALSACSAATGGAPSTADIPSDPLSVPSPCNGGSLTSTTSDHQLTGQQFQMFGGTLVNNVSYTGTTVDTTSQSLYQNIHINFSTAAKNTRVYFYFGGHLAAGGTPPTSPRGWGDGCGAASINGGPYHIKVNLIDGASAGNRDNQIMSSAILPLTGTSTTTALHQTDSGGTDLIPNNNESATGTGITVNLPADGSGAYVTDYATVAPSNVTGTVDFAYYGTSSACTAATNANEGGTSAGTGETLTSGVAKSSTILFTSPGTIYWRAFYQATGSNISSSSACSEEVLTLDQNTTTATTLHQTDSSGVDVTPTANNGDPITVPINSYVVDYGMVTPSSSTGAVAFRLYSGSTASTDCSSDTTGTGGVGEGGTASSTAGTWTSNTYHATNPGDFYWKAFFTGTGSYNSSASSCEHLIVLKGSPGAGSAPSLIPNDTVTVSGLTTGGASSGTADQKMTVSLYGPADTDCTGTALFTQTFTVTANQGYVTTNDGNPASTPKGYTISPSGTPPALTSTTYHWGVVYDGDTLNNGFSFCTTNGTFDETVTAAIQGK